MALTGKSLRHQLPCNLQLPVRRYLVWGIECPRPLNKSDAKDLGSPFCYEYSTGARLQKAQLQKLKEAWNSCEVSVNNAFNTTRPRPDKLPMPHHHRSGSLIPFPVLTSNQLICGFVGVLFLKNNGVFLSALDRLSTTNLSWNPNAIKDSHYHFGEAWVDMSQRRNSHHYIMKLLATKWSTLRSGMVTDPSEEQEDTSAFWAALETRWPFLQRSCCLLMSLNCCKEKGWINTVAWLGENLTHAR